MKLHKLLLVTLGLFIFMLQRSESYTAQRRMCSLVKRIKLKSLRKSSGVVPVAEPPKYVVGEDIPEEIMKQSAIYDMILVERISSPAKTISGLFLPVVEGKYKRHLGKVLSIPTSYGLEGENGRLCPIQEIAPFKVGDIVFIKVKSRPRYPI